MFIVDILCVQLTLCLYTKKTIIYNIHTVSYPIRYISYIAEYRKQNYIILLDLVRESRGRCIVSVSTFKYIVQYLNINSMMNHCNSNIAFIIAHIIQ